VVETLDTQSTAILQFLKAKGIGSEADLAPYFEEAGNASSVRWRAVRVRIDYLISSASTRPLHKTQGAGYPNYVRSAGEGAASHVSTGSVRSGERSRHPEASSPSFTIDDSLQKDSLSIGN